MLSRLRVQNFRCLRDVTVDFEPLTVLIGKNDSGKTSILDAIRVLGRTFDEPYSQVFVGPNEHRSLSWQRVNQDIAWRIEVADGFGGNKGTYSFSWPSRVERATFGGQASDFDVKGRVWSGQATVASGIAALLVRKLYAGVDAESIASTLGLKIDEVSDAIGALRAPTRFRFSPDALRSASRPAPDAVLSSSGDNLAAVLDRIFSGFDASRRMVLERDLHAAIPTLSGVSLRTLEDGKKTIEYVLAGASKRPITIPCENASDGALLVTAYLALAYSDAPGTLLIEEPENGLHPSLLRLVFETLHKISTGEYGLGPRQVIIATQSPLLLNYATKEEVRIVRRDLETGTQVTRLADVPDIDRLLKGFSVGELWYHLGEDALVDGEKAEEAEEAE